MSDPTDPDDDYEWREPTLKDWQLPEITFANFPDLPQWFLRQTLDEHMTRVAKGVLKRLEKHPPGWDSGRQIKFVSTLHTIDLPPLVDRDSYPVCGIYILQHIGTGLMYVGQSADIAKRLNQHRTQYTVYPLFVLAHADADGWDCFRWGVLEECEIEELNRRETMWITRLGTCRAGLNYDFGGDFKGRRHGKSILGTVSPTYYDIEFHTPPWERAESEMDEAVREWWQSVGRAFLEWAAVEEPDDGEIAEGPIRYVWGGCKSPDQMTREIADDFRAWFRADGEMDRAVGIWRLRGARAPSADSDRNRAAAYAGKR